MDEENEKENINPENQEKATETTTETQTSKPTETETPTENLSDEEKKKIGIGDIETNNKLEAKPVTILGSEIVPVKFEKGSSEKVVFICKHPDKDDPIKISSAKLELDDKLKVKALWFSLDAEKKLVKNAFISQFLRHLKCDNLGEAVGKTPLTTLDESGYLCFKAYD